MTSSPLRRLSHTTQTNKAFNMSWDTGAGASGGGWDYGAGAASFDESAGNGYSGSGYGGDTNDFGGNVVGAGTFGRDEGESSGGNRRGGCFNCGQDG